MRCSTEKASMVDNNGKTPTFATKSAVTSHNYAADRAMGMVVNPTLVAARYHTRLRHADHSRQE